MENYDYGVMGIVKRNDPNSIFNYCVKFWPSYSRSLLSASSPIKVCRDEVTGSVSAVAEVFFIFAQ